MTFKNSIIYLAALLTLMSCQKQDYFKLPENGNSPGRMLAVAAYNKHFLTDFICNPSGDKVPVKDFFREIQNARESDKNKLAENYQSIKPTLLEWGEKSHEKEGKLDLIQAIALPYMRNLFLSSSPIKIEDQKELSLLLPVVMTTSPVDIDVITDAYLACKEILTSEQQDVYYNYLAKLYAEEQQKIVVDFQDAKERYSSAQNDNEKYGAIISGKRLERMSLSLAYANKKLKLQNAHRH